MSSTVDAGRQPLGTSDGGVDQIARAVAAVRRATAALVGVADGEVDLFEVAARVHALADDLEARAPAAHDRMHTMERDGRVMLYGSVVGTHNAIAPPVDFREVEGGLEGTVALSAACERAPGVVHEGVIAMILDVALAEANRVARTAGMTAQLNMRFHRPVPSGQELIIRSRLDRADGRKAYARAEVWGDGDVLVSADGLFISSRNRVTDA